MATKWWRASAQSNFESLAHGDANDDFCSICELPGILICCEGACFRAFHLECLGISDAASLDGDYFCDLCSGAATVAIAADAQKPRKNALQGPAALLASRLELSPLQAACASALTHAAAGLLDASRAGDSQAGVARGCAALLRGLSDTAAVASEPLRMGLVGPLEAAVAAWAGGGDASDETAAAAAGEGGGAEMSPAASPSDAPNVGGGAVAALAQAVSALAATVIPRSAAALLEEAMAEGVAAPPPAPMADASAELATKDPVFEHPGAPLCPARLALLRALYACERCGVLDKRKLALASLLSQRPTPLTDGPGGAADAFEAAWLCEMLDLGPLQALHADDGPSGAIAQASATATLAAHAELNDLRDALAACRRDLVAAPPPSADHLQTAVTVLLCLSSGAEMRLPQTAIVVEASAVAEAAVAAAVHELEGREGEPDDEAMAGSRGVSPKTRLTAGRAYSLASALSALSSIDAPPRASDSSVKHGGGVVMKALLAFLTRLSVEQSGGERSATRLDAVPALCAVALACALADARLARAPLLPPRPAADADELPVTSAAFASPRGLGPVPASLLLTEDGGDTEPSLPGPNTRGLPLLLEQLSLRVRSLYVGQGGGGLLPHTAGPGQPHSSPTVPEKPIKRVCGVVLDSDDEGGEEKGPMVDGDAEAAGVTSERTPAPATSAATDASVSSTAALASASRALRLAERSAGYMLEAAPPPLPQRSAAPPRPASRPGPRERSAAQEPTVRAAPAPAIGLFSSAFGSRGGAGAAAPPAYSAAAVALRKRRAAELRRRLAESSAHDRDSAGMLALLRGQVGGGETGGAPPALAGQKRPLETGGGQEEEKGEEEASGQIDEHEGRDADAQPPASPQGRSSSQPQLDAVRAVEAPVPLLPPPPPPPPPSSPSSSSDGSAENPALFIESDRDGPRRCPPPPAKKPPPARPPQPPAPSLPPAAPPPAPFPQALCDKLAGMLRAEAVFVSRLTAFRQQLAASAAGTVAAGAAALPLVGSASLACARCHRGLPAALEVSLHALFLAVLGAGGSAALAQAAPAAATPSHCRWAAMLRSTDARIATRGGGGSYPLQTLMPVPEVIDSASSSGEDVSLNGLCDVLFSDSDASTTRGVSPDSEAAARGCSDCLRPMLARRGALLVEAAGAAAQAMWLAQGCAAFEATFLRRLQAQQQSK